MQLSDMERHRNLKELVLDLWTTAKSQSGTNQDKMIKILEHEELEGLRGTFVYTDESVCRIHKKFGVSHLALGYNIIRWIS
jgi:hypothetical protein